MKELIRSARPVPAPGCVLSAQARVDMCPVCGEKPPPCFVCAITCQPHSHSPAEEVGAEGRWGVGWE